MSIVLLLTATRMNQRTQPALTRYPNKTHYSRHFTRKELNCKCGCKTPLRIRRRLRRLALSLEKMRNILGPIGVVSAYRCKSRNRIVGGAVKSQHITGRAADLAVPRGKQSTYVAAATQVPAFNNGGIGVYPHGGVHVDYRPWRARWNSYVGQR
jgi:uncharacterized protein YcbK (DUF882 family)